MSRGRRHRIFNPAGETHIAGSNPAGSIFAPSFSNVVSNIGVQKKIRWSQVRALPGLFRITSNMKLPTDYTILTPAQRKEVREEYIRRQGNKCYWCGTSLDKKPSMPKEINWKLFPPGFQDYPVHLQHCHSTGLTEGAVHMYCNAYMWQYHGR